MAHADYIPRAFASASLSFSSGMLVHVTCIIVSTQICEPMLSVSFTQDPQSHTPHHTDTPLELQASKEAGPESATTY